MSKRLHLGCGLIAPAEWVNVDGSRNAWLAQRPRLRKLGAALRLVPRAAAEVDWPENVVYADVSSRLPFADASFSAAYSSHLVEHLHRDQALVMLREVLRVLEPGGICRTLVPDLASVVERYLDRRQRQDAGEGIDAAREFNRDLYMREENTPPAGRLKSMVYGGKEPHAHKLLYDAPSLVLLMQEAGFANCRQRGFHQSDIPGIQAVEVSHRFEGGIGVAVEGIKSD